MLFILYRSALNIKTSFSLLDFINNTSVINLFTEICLRGVKGANQLDFKMTEGTETWGA